MRAGGVLKLERAYSVSSTAWIRASWGPFLQSPVALCCLPRWPSAAFPAVPLKTPVAPGQLLSFGSEESPVFQRRLWYLPSTCNNCQYE